MKINIYICLFSLLIKHILKKYVFSNIYIEMGSSASKNEETNEIKAVQEMDEEELSSKDKLFKKAIVEIYEELKKVKDQKKDKFIYTVPKVDLCNWSLF